MPDTTCGRPDRYRSLLLAFSDQMYVRDQNGDIPSAGDVARFT